MSFKVSSSQVLNLLSAKTLNRLTWAISICGLMLVLIEANRIYTSFTNYDREDYYDQLHGLSEDILLTHEKLSISASTYLLTDNAKWLENYDQLKQAQHDNIIQLKQMTPALLANVTSDIHSYSDHLLDNETSAFMLHKAGFPDEALDLLTAEEYITLKEKLGGLFNNIIAHVSQTRSSTHNAALNANIIDVCIFLFLLTLMFSVQFLAIRWLRQWRRELTNKDMELETMVDVLRNRESSFRDLVNAVPQGLVAVDSYGGIIHANVTATQWLGADVTVTGNHVFEKLRLPKSVLDMLYDTENGIRTEAHGTRHTLNHTGDDGTARSLELTLHPLGDNYSHLIIVSDLTLRMEAARATQARFKAERENQTKSDFLANMSHELRTPMHGIIGFAEILNGTSLTPAQHESVTTILRSAKSLLALLNDILDFSKIQAGQISLEQIPFNIEEEVRETLLILRSAATAKSIKLKISFDGPKYTVGDPMRLRQILLNLISNAIKFTPQDGQVTLDVEAKEADIGSPTMFHFKVTDTGIGIPPDKQDDIFNKFTQADNSTSRKYGGTGLGLAITRQLVELMQGKIGVKSTQGQGSTFWFSARLTVADPESLKPVYTPVEAQAGSTADQNCAILLVDDNKVNLMLAKRILQSQGYHNLKDALNGKQALEILQQQPRHEPIKLILMDCQMPEMDGYEATFKWRDYEKQNGLPHTPIVALTANALAGTRDVCLQAGMDDMLVKPFDKQALLNLVAIYTADKRP